MPRYGDLLAKLAAGNTMTIGEQNELRVLGNQQEAATATVNAWSGGAGNLDPNLFQSYSPVSFSVLPHECGALYQISVTAQVIPNDTWTSVTADTHATTAATWSEGLKLDEANSRILVVGIPGETVVSAIAWAGWAANTTGVRGVRWVANDGSLVAQVRGADTISHATAGASVVAVAHMRKVPTSHTYYYIQVYQNSGGNLALDGAYLAMARLR